MSGAGLLLASASPRRLELLAQIGVVPSAVRAPDIDETPLREELPRDYARRIALAKAAASPSPGDFVIAADTVVAVGRRILGKAEDEASARRCLGLLSGRRHHVWSAVVVVAPDGRQALRLVDSAVTFVRLETARIEAYVAGGEWHGKAGGYAIQGRAAKWIPRIEGCYFNVVGLPLALVATMLDGIESKEARREKVR